MFPSSKVCNACVRGKNTKFSFMPKKDVSTFKPLQLLHMDLCVPVKLASRGGKKYILAIVDDYSRFTQAFFPKPKDETFHVFEAFSRQMQVFYNKKIVAINSDHGI